MATQIQTRRGTTAQHSSFTGAVGEVTVDTDKDTLVVHDGATAGGRELYHTDLPFDGKITAMAALDVDCSAGNYFTKTIAADSTFTFSNVPSGRAYSFTLELTHTSGTITWPTAVKWNNNSAPTLLTGVVHLFMFVTSDGGTTFRASALVNYVS